MVDPKKQKLQREHHQILQTISDNWDQLTTTVKIKKLEEYIRRKKHEELQKNQTADKKNQSTAYRPTSLPVPQPVSASKEGGKLGSPDNDKNFDSENEDQVNENYNHEESKAVETEIKKTEADQQSDLSEGEQMNNQVVDSALTHQASHAKCILDLSFTKFKWNINEDFAHFHRPDIQESFDHEREVQAALPGALLNNDFASKQTITIDASGQISSRPNPKQKEDKWCPVSIQMQVIDRELIKRKNKKRGIINADEYFKDRQKLSLKDGKFCLFEHIDENPIYVNNFGMVSKLYRYVYNDQIIPNEAFVPGRGDQNLAHMGPYGLQILKNQSSKLPLLGGIDKSLFKGITVMTNNLYHVPVFYHRPKSSDFFCSVFQDKKGQKHIVLREIQDVFAVGQLEPKVPVYNP